MMLRAVLGLSRENPDSARSRSCTDSERLAARSRMHCAVLQEKPATLARITAMSGLSSSIARSTRSIGAPVMSDSATAVSSNLRASAKRVDFLLAEPPGLVQRFHLGARRGVVGRGAARRGADVAADFGDDIADRGGCRRIGGGELLAHRRGGALDQLEQMLARQDRGACRHAPPAHRRRPSARPACGMPRWRSARRCSARPSAPRRGRRARPAHR